MLSEFVTYHYFLGLRNLTVIDDAVREIQRTEPAFDMASIPEDDAAAFAMLGEGKTAGVFQLESGGMRRLLMGMQPRTIFDITAAIALYRPGPMDSIPHYLACRDGRETPNYEVPELADILGDTEGCIVYQEQVMQIFRRLAGYSFARADIVRRAMSKKKGKVLDAELDGFVAGAEARGITAEAARSIFERMHRFAEYAFNKSHAAAYATLSFRTAYLRAHYPREYFAALLTSVLGDQTKTAQYVGEAAREGIPLLPPDINESEKTFSVSKEGIRFGLLALRGVGGPSVDALLAERARGRFTSFRDFLDRMESRELNRRQVEALIKSGAFDRLGTFRSQLLSSYEAMMDELSDRQRANVSGQIDIFSMGGAQAPVAEVTYPDIPELGLRELLTLEKESAGLYFSGHIIDDYKADLDRHGCAPISEILEAFSENEDGNERYSDGGRVTVGGMITRRVNKALKNGSSMSILTLEDRYGEIDAIAFEKTLEKYRAVLQVDCPVAVTGKLSVKEGQRPEVVIYAATSLASQGTQPQEHPKRLYLRVRSLEDDRCRAALALLPRHPGDTEVAVYDSSSKRYVTVSERRITPDDELLSALSRILGQTNVVIK